MCRKRILKSWPVAAIFLKFAGTLLHIGGTATDNWLNEGDISVGIFKACSGGDCANLLNALDNAVNFNFKSKVTATQTFAVFAILIAAGTFAMSIVQYFVDHLTRSCYRLRMGISILSLLMAVSAFIFIMFCALMVNFADSEQSFTLKDLKINHVIRLKDFETGYSLVLSVVGVLIATGGLVAVLHDRREEAARKSQSAQARTSNPEDNVADRNVPSLNDIEMQSIGLHAESDNSKDQINDTESAEEKKEEDGKADGQ